MKRKEFVDLVFVGLLATWAGLAGDQKVGKVVSCERGARELPATVVDTLLRRFPKAVIRSWKFHDENGTQVHDLEFTQAARVLNASIRQDGSLLTWETQIPLTELPPAVRLKIEDRYSRCRIQEAVALYEVVAGSDVPQAFEVVVRISRGKTVEMMLAPDGHVIEDAGVLQPLSPVDTQNHTSSQYH